jgi:hypothetical protein
MYRNNRNKHACFETNLKIHLNNTHLKNRYSVGPTLVGRHVQVHHKALADRHAQVQQQALESRHVQVHHKVLVDRHAQEQ